MICTVSVSATSTMAHSLLSLASTLISVLMVNKSQLLISCYCRIASLPCYYIMLFAFCGVSAIRSLIWDCRFDVVDFEYILIFAGI